MTDQTYVTWWECTDIAARDEYGATKLNAIMRCLQPNTGEISEWAASPGQYVVGRRYDFALTLKN